MRRKQTEIRSARLGLVGLLAGACLLLGLAAPAAADPMDPGHPGDVFVRMDKQGEGGVVEATLIYKFNKGDVPVLAEEDTYWSPSFPSEGLSVDKYERMLVVKNAPDTDATPALTRGQYQELHIPTGTSTTRNTPQGTAVGLPTDWEDYFWIPDPVMVGPCKQPQTLSQHGGYCNPGGPVRHPPGMSNNQTMPFYQTNVGFDWRILGFKNWGLARGINSSPECYVNPSSGPPCMPARNPDLPGQEMPNIRNRGANVLVSAETIAATAKNKQIVAYVSAADEVNDAELSGLGCDRAPVNDCPGNEIGNLLVTEITSQVGYSFFSTCGDSCISGPSEALGDAFGPTPPTRILFGSEGQTIADQKAYTVRGAAGSLEVKSLSLIAQGDAIPGGGICGQFAGCWHEDDVPEAKKYFTYSTNLLTAKSFGNAASLDSYLPNGSDYIYLSDQDPDHFAVSSRFWRTGGTAFTYDHTIGGIKWFEHTFDPVAPPPGSTDPVFAAPTAVEGVITIGNIAPNDIAIAADGKGNVYWLRRTLTPPHEQDMDGDTILDAPDPNTMAGGGLYDPNWMTNPARDDDTNVDYSQNWYEWDQGIPPAYRSYYAEQKDEAPIDDNPQRLPYKRYVKVRQFPSYELKAFNYITEGNRAPTADATGANATGRGTVARGEFQYIFVAECPQVELPSRWEPPTPAPIVSPIDYSPDPANLTYIDSARLGSGTDPGPGHSMEELIPGIQNYYEVTLGQPFGTRFDENTVTGSWVEVPSSVPGEPPESRYRIDTKTWKERYLVFSYVNPVSPPGGPAPDSGDVFHVEPYQFPSWPAIEEYPAPHNSTAPSIATTPSGTGFASVISGGCTPLPGIASNENDDPAQSCSSGDITTGAHVFVMEVTATETYRYEQDNYHPVGPPDFDEGYEWTDNVLVTEFNEESFGLDMAAVNVTEPPAATFPDTVIDLVFSTGSYVGGDLVVGEDSTPSIAVENPPQFSGIYTVPGYGAMNGNVPGQQGCCVDANGQAPVGHFGGNVVQRDFNYRWRVLALTGPARYAYDSSGGGGTGGAVPPDPSNDGVMYKTEWVDFGLGSQTIGNDAFPMEIPAGAIRFGDPGKYRIVLDVKGMRWTAPGGLSFFSRPDALSWVKFTGVYDLASDDPVGGPMQTGDMASAFFNMSGDLDEYNDTNTTFARTYRDIVVRAVATDETDYVHSVQLVGPTEVGEDVGGENSSPARDEGPADLPPSMDPTLAQELYTTDAAADDLSGLVATFKVHWYRADDYQYDQDLAGAAGVSFGLAGDEPTDATMNKFGGVGTAFRPSECGAFDPGNEVHVSLRDDGLLASLDPAGPENSALWGDCQTHLGAIRPRDWWDIKYTWYMKVDDPETGGMLPDDTGLGVPVSRGTLAELLDLQTNGPARDALGVGGTFDLLLAGTGDYPAPRDYDVTLPLFGRDGAGAPVPLEIAVPTSPDNQVYFTVVIEYPKIQWTWSEQDDAGEDLYYRIEQAGSDYAIYGGPPGNPGSVPHPAAPNGADPTGANGFYVPVTVLDRTYPWFVGTENLGGEATAAGRSLATTGTKVTVKLRDNNPYNGDEYPKLSRFQYTLTQDSATSPDPDPRNSFQQVWNDPNGMGVGLMMDGGNLGFDLSFRGDVGAPTGGSFLRSPDTNQDFPGAPANNNNGGLVWFYQVGAGNGAAIDPDSVSSLLDPAATVVFDGDPPVSFTQVADPEGPNVSTDAPEDWVRWRQTALDPVGGPYAPGSGIVAGNTANNVSSLWETDHYRLPLSPFIRSGGDLIAIALQSRDRDGPDAAMTLDEALPGQTVRDLSRPNVIVELVDHRSATPVYFAAVTDYRQPWGDGLQQASEDGWDTFRVIVGEDTRDVMEGDGRDAATDFDGRFIEPVGGIVDFADFTGLTPDARDAAAGMGSYDWRVEEDVMFRVRVLATDNAARPDQIGIGIRSFAGGPNPPDALPAAPRQPFWNGTDDAPPRASDPNSPVRVIAGKALLETHHRYSKEDTEDVIEVVVCDYQGVGCGNMRKLRIPIATRPHDTDIRVISDQVRRGTD